MAFGNKKVNIKITAENNASGPINEVKGEIKNLGNEAVQSNKEIGMSFTEINQALEVIKKTVSFVTESFDKLFEAGKAGAADIDLMNTSFRRFGDVTDTLERLKEAVNYTQSETQLLTFSNTMARFGLNVEQAAGFLQVLKVASRETNQSIDQLSTQMISAVSSSRGLLSLRRVLGTEIVNTIESEIQAYEKLNGALDSNERAQMGMSLIAKNASQIIAESGGTVEAATDKYNQLDASYANLVSTIGITIDESRTFDYWVKLLNESISEFNTSLNQTKKEDFPSHIDEITNKLSGMEEVALGLQPLMSYIFGTEETSMMAKTSDEIKATFEKTMNEAKKIQEEVNSLFEKTTSRKEIATSQVGAIGVKSDLNVDQLKEFNYEMKESTMLARIQAKEISELQRELNSMVDANFNNVMNLSDQLESELQQTVETYSAFLEQLIEGTFQSIGFMLGQAIAGVNVTADQLFASLLDLLGTFMIQMGTVMFTVIGPAFAALASFNPIAAVAAGLALVAAGGVLKGIAAELRSGGAALGAGGGQVGQANNGGGFYGQQNQQLSPGTGQRENEGQTIINIDIQGSLIGSEQELARVVGNAINGNAGRGAPLINARAIA